MSKLRSLHDAIAADIHDGDSIALSGVKDHREFRQLLGKNGSKNCGRWGIYLHPR
jgi:acyl CoA:acetate/3-ketoacid CoA transferase alpha subunit